MSELNKMMTKKQIDYHNRLMLENGERTDYICVMCRKYINLDDGYSCRGYNMLCSYCYSTMAEVLNISKTQLLDIIHTRFKIPARPNIDTVAYKINNLVKACEFSSDEVMNATYETFYRKYINIYFKILNLEDTFKKVFKENYEQNMNKKDVDNPYQE